MKDLKVACDVEEVLAHSLFPWFLKLYFERGVVLSLEDIEEWGLDNLKEVINNPLEDYTETTSKIWREAPNVIPLTERNLVEELKTLYTITPFDLVTSREEVDGIRKWCEFHKIPYRKILFVPPKERKNKYKYDIFIDDNPFLAEEIEKSDNQILLLYDRPWNRNIKESKKVKRVRNFEEVNARVSEYKFKELINAAIIERLYARSFKTKVGASLLLKNGEIFSGYNIEHKIHKGIHAEVLALLKALSKMDYKGEDAVAIAIVFANKEYPINHFPACAECRQYLWENTNPDLLVIAASPDGSVYRTKRLSQLYPYPFPSKPYR